MNYFKKSPSTLRKLILLILVLNSSSKFAQPGKDGALTITATGQTLNRYFPVLSDITANSYTVEIPSASPSSFLPGDLIMIYQAQGATTSSVNGSAYGDILNYNSSGLYEFRYIRCVNGNTLVVDAAFTNSYSVTGYVQCVKVPQFTTLTIAAGAEVTAGNWRDTVINAPFRFGGIIAIHANSIVNNGTITAAGRGFRGGPADSDVSFVYWESDYTTALSSQGGIKGESIAGYLTEYDLNGGRYCRGAPANGGGGGNAHNAGGGGGANGTSGNPWTGEGIMIADVNNPLMAWSLSPTYINNNNSLTNSSGGGHGGYSWSNANANALLDGPGNFVWQGDQRRETGGLGGRPLNNINADSRIYYGGGGGSGEANNLVSPPASNGGGIVYLISTTGISGSGLISANGYTVADNSGCSCDGPSGAGAGGSIVLKCASVVSTQTVMAMGGRGGNQLQLSSPAAITEGDGPGGGGGGGFVAISAGGVTPLVNGGSNGSTQSVSFTEFPYNGATSGAIGQTGFVSSAFVSYNLNPQISSNSPQCVPATVWFSTSASAMSYSWSGPNGFSSVSPSVSMVNSNILMSGIYTLTLNYHNGCTTTTTVAILLNKCLVGTGEETSAANKMILYPNPSKGEFSFDAPAAGTMTVHDLLGRCVLNMAYTPGKGLLNLKHLPSGTYLLKTSYGGISNTIKLIKTE